MAQKRMFDKTITNSDDFLELPDSSQVLYFHLNMNADDDGFVNNWKSIIRMTGTKEDDLKILIAKSFVIPFESGVIVIKHWRINNYLRNDRYKQTNYKEELSMLNTNDNGEYLLNNNIGIPMVDLDKNSIEENSIDKNNKENNIKESKHKYGEYKNVLLTDKELQSLKSDYDNYNDLIKYLDEYIEMKGYKAKSHYLCIKKWVVKAIKQNKSYINEPIWMDKENYSEIISNKELEELEKEMSIFE